MAATIATPAAAAAGTAASQPAPAQPGAELAALLGVEELGAPTVAEAMQADLGSLSAYDRSRVGLAGYRVALSQVAKPPGVAEAFAREAAELQRTANLKLARLKAERARLAEQATLAVRSGAVLKQVYRASFAAESLKRRVPPEGEAVDPGAGAAEGYALASLGLGDLGRARGAAAEEEKLRDDLRRVEGVHRGLSTVWLSEALREWRLGYASLVKYSNVDQEHGFVSDTPIDGHWVTFRDPRCHVTTWTTSNPVAMISVGLLSQGNYLGVPLFEPVETNENYERALAQADVGLSSPMRGVVASVALSANESIAAEDAKEEHVDLADALDEKDDETETAHTVKAVYDWLLRDATGREKEGRGIGKKWVAAALCAALVLFAAYFAATRQPAAPGATPTGVNLTAWNRTGKLTGNLSDFADAVPWASGNTTGLLLKNGTVVVIEAQ